MKSTKRTFAFRGKYFFVAVVCLYGVLWFVDPDSVQLALQEAAQVLIKIIPILAIVILFTALLNYLLKPKQIMKHLGKESGLKGWCYAILAGLISHGPMYVWYAMIDELRSHGLRDSLIVTFYFARAVKLPLLPLMVDYFGIVFTCVLSFYIVVGALVLGFVYQVAASD